MRSRTILLGGFSKNYAMTGWRAGFACGPANIIKGLVRVHQYTIMSAPTMSQFAALEAIQHGQKFVIQMRDEYDRRRKLIVSGLNQLGLPTFEPHGAFYAFPNVPGNSFGAGGEGYVRCSYATAYEKIEEALNRMQHFMHHHG
jgi:aminotransferase